MLNGGTVGEKNKSTNKNFNLNTRINELSPVNKL